MSLIILLLLVSVTQGNILTQLVNSVRYVWAAKHQDCPTTCGNAVRIGNCTSDLCQGIQIEAHNCLHLPPCSKITFGDFSLASTTSKSLFFSFWTPSEKNFLSTKSSLFQCTETTFLAKRGPFECHAIRSLAQGSQKW